VTTRYRATRDEYRAVLAGRGEPKYRADQVYDGLWTQRRPLHALTNVGQGLRDDLAAAFPEALAPLVEQHGDGGLTTKWLWAAAGGVQIETVLMRYKDRATVCISSQAGCAMGCTFCATGQAGFERHLDAGEICEQVLRAQHTSPQRVGNVVYMGMGEPLANYSATVKSLRLLTDPQGFAFSPRRITVSTVGLVSGIERLAKENLRVNLAVSLHATSNEIRDRIMPVNRGFAIEELLAACRRFPLPFRQRMTFEYVLLDGVNDSVEDARRLVKLLKGIRGKINLIPFNDWEGSSFARPSLARILDFQTVLLEHGIRATVRWSKGEDIGAACGQLREAAVTA
jgi:23S rRNA (adenine2503-C2)-methyltransferase